MWKGDANAAGSTVVTLMFCWAKITVNYSLELILWGVRDGSASWYWCWNCAGRACKCRPVARRPGAHSKCPPSGCRDVLSRNLLFHSQQWHEMNNLSKFRWTRAYVWLVSIQSFCHSPPRKGTIAREQCPMVSVTKMLQESSEWFTKHSLSILPRERQLVCLLIIVPGRVSQRLMNGSSVSKREGHQAPRRALSEDGLK